MGACLSLAEADVVIRDLTVSLCTQTEIADARGRLLADAEAERDKLRLRVAELEAVNAGMKAAAKVAMRAVAREANRALDSIESRMRAAGIPVGS